MTTVAAPTRDAAHTVASGELAAFLDLLRALEPQDWGRPTDCTGWSVRDVVAHVTGAMEEGARMRVLLRHFALAPRRHPAMAALDAVNQTQIDERRGDTTAQLVDELARLGPRAARARRRMPGLVRRLPVPGDTGLPAGATFGYLVDVIYPRDLWMHRLDVERATGRGHAATSTEREVVAQVVRDLDATWSGPTVVLELTGPGGGTWQLGDGHASGTLTAEATEVCRMLSGRPAAPDVRTEGAPGARARLEEARIAF